MKFASTRLITDRLDQLVEFYELVTGLGDRHERAWR